MHLMADLSCHGLPQWLSGKESASSAGDVGLIPGSGRCPGGGHGNPLQYSCLENPMGRGAWRALWGHEEPDTSTHEKMEPIHHFMPCANLSKKLSSSAALETRVNRTASDRDLVTTN